MATLLGDFHRKEKSLGEQAPWKAINRLWFAFGAGILLISVLLIVHVLKSKVDAPLDLGFNHVTWLLIGAVTTSFGLFLVVRNRHS